MAKKQQRSTMKLSTRLERLIAALEREKESQDRIASIPNAGARAKVRFEARSKVLKDFIEILQEVATEKEENLLQAIVTAQAVIDEDRFQTAEAIEDMRVDLWATDEETPEEDKADKDYPQLWIPTAEHDTLQRLQKQIGDMLRAQEEGRK